MARVIRPLLRGVRGGAARRRGALADRALPQLPLPDEGQHVDLITQVEQAVAWPWPDPGTLRMAQGSSAGGLRRAHLAPLCVKTLPGLSNSRLDGINAKIRLIQRRGHGFRNLDALSAAIYLCLGGVTLELPTER